MHPLPVGCTPSSPLPAPPRQMHPLLSPSSSSPPDAPPPLRSSPLLPPPPTQTTITNSFLHPPSRAPSTIGSDHCSRWPDAGDCTVHPISAAQIWTVMATARDVATGGGLRSWRPRAKSGRLSISSPPIAPGPAMKGLGCWGRGCRAIAP